MTLNSRTNSYEEVMPYYCSMCGKHEDAKFFDNKRMVDKKLCFSCNFWDALVTRVNETIRIKGIHYMIGPKKTSHKWNGHGGKSFTIKMNDGQIITTCDLWCQGEVPESFKTQLPDNAEFLATPADSIKRVNLCSESG